MMKLIINKIKCMKSIYFGRGKVQPIVSVSGGWYLMSQTVMADAGVGCSFRSGRVFNM